MRLRNWLLAGTSVGMLALAPFGTASAQDAELTAAYQAYVEAQASGDAAATEAALGSFTELCIVAGYPSVEECIAAAEAQAAAPAEAAPVPEPAPAPAEPAPEAAAPAPEPAPAEQPAAEPTAEAPPPAEEAPAPAAEAAPEPAPAPVTEEPAPVEAPVVEAAPAPEAAPAAEPAPAETPAPAPVEEPAAPDAPAPAAEATPEATQAQFEADLNAALQQYQEALNLAASGDVAGAETLAADAEARIQQLCTDNGYPSIEACIGQTLPPLPEAAPEAAPAEAPPAAEEAAPAEPVAPAEEPAAEAPAEAPAVETPDAADGVVEQPAPETPAADPTATAQADLTTAVELYTIGADQLRAGDTAGQATIDAANAQINDICAGLGQTDIAACLSQFGLALPELPSAPEPTVEAEQPAAEQPAAAAEPVTPDAVEALPEEIAPEQAAPVLDSAKEQQPAPAEGETPAGQPTVEQPAAETAQPAVEEPAAAPTTDVEAQSRIAPREVQSIEAEQGGGRVTVEALPSFEVPQNVTIINNVNNVTNETNASRNVTNNYTNSGFVFEFNGNFVISNPGQELDRIYDEDEDEVFYEELRNGRVRETVVRPNGVRVVTIRNRYGQILKRSRFSPEGREYILAYYDEEEDVDDFIDWRDPGEELPPLRLTIPIREYILDAEEADVEEVEEFFRLPPVENVREIYSIEDVKRSARIRDTVRRLEVGGLTFDTGAATISRDQVGALSKVANAMLALLDDNPAEVFLIEGHTDAVGSDLDNLRLSDRRAATVARILSDFYEIPPENLVTQGYGERYLKVRTEEAERLNRRATIKRITPLVTVASN